MMRHLPGSFAAIAAGCTCSPYHNQWGYGPERTSLLASSFVVAPGCPLHEATTTIEPPVVRLPLVPLKHRQPSAAPRRFVPPLDAMRPPRGISPSRPDQLRGPKTPLGALRRAARLSQVAVATALDVEQSAVSAWERGAKPIYANKRTALAQLLGVDESALPPARDDRSEP